MYETMANIERRATIRDHCEENDRLATECLNAALSIDRFLEPPEPMEKPAQAAVDEEYLQVKLALTSDKLKQLHKTLGRIADSLGLIS